jgi:phosphate transport system protein
MAHYEERLNEDVAQLREEMCIQAAEVEKALERATHAFLTRNRQEASAVILGDHPLNRRAREIDRQCHAFVARHVPGAGHLRFVSSVMRMNISLERIGDYAVTIGRETAQLKQKPPESMVRDIELLADHGRQILNQAMIAFRENSADLARGTMAMAGKKGRVFHQVFTDLLQEGEQGTRVIEDLFGILVVLYRLERVRDQAKNICEDTVFIATGVGKQPKVYSILFIDEGNDRLSEMAEAIARKAFPESGAFYSVGHGCARLRPPEPDAHASRSQPRCPLRVPRRGEPRGGPLGSDRGASLSHRPPELGRGRSEG